MPETRLGRYTVDEYLSLIEDFHGFQAPGLILGGFMVQAAMERIPPRTLSDAVSETAWCLPDAIQLLTPCTVGNGWLKIVQHGVYALALYDKYTGHGIRVFLDATKLDSRPLIKEWFLKLKPKQEQDSPGIRHEILQAGADICSFETVQAGPRLLDKRSKGRLGACPLCGEIYPLQYGELCRACQGDSPYISRSGSLSKPPAFKAYVPPAMLVEEALGRAALHDMTRIEPGRSKGPEFLAGETITAGDVCRLHRMGKARIFVQDETEPGTDWIHENQAAEAFAKAMAGPGVVPQGPPREGKVNLAADRDGLLVVDRDVLTRFNLVPQVMCATRHTCRPVRSGTRVAGTRAIPLYLHASLFRTALSVLDEGPLVKVEPIRPLTTGILVTGTEIFNGLVEDKFAPIIRGKVSQYGCPVLDPIIAPDQARAVRDGARALLEAGAELLITTAGLSVDPDDVTRQGLVEAGATDLVYGAPILPGAMTLLARIDRVPVIGVPACALFFKTTSLDLLLPRILADVAVTRADLADLAEGGLCHECKICTFPKCGFGR
ncbi:MAG: trehalose-binding protein [Deltaproteobacteria bacterium]|nr:trehalose-binding protein [Deltaproteobacteria bacterium]